MPSRQETIKLGSGGLKGKIEENII